MIALLTQLAPNGTGPSISNVQNNFSSIQATTSITYFVECGTIPGTFCVLVVFNTTSTRRY